MEQHYISAERLTVARLQEILDRRMPIALSEDARQRIARCREYLDNRIEHAGQPIYGITTGFGSLCDISVGRDELAQLQRNVQLRTVERLVDFYNHGVLPVVYQQGSLGASGDLAPLAHLSLPLLGLGEVEYEGRRRPASDVLAELGWEPIELQSKEGLALLNGTQFMSAYGVWSLMAARRLSDWADRIGALSLDAFDGRIEPFYDEVHLIRAHRGQLATARAVRRLLEGSELIGRPKRHVQRRRSTRRRTIRRSSPRRI